jgi:ABC-type Na+ efflux pump permease subunit
MEGFEMVEQKESSGIKRAIVIALKDLRMMLRERTFVTVIMLLIFVASFASVLTFGLLIMYNPAYLDIFFEKEIKVGVAGKAPVLESFLNAEHYDSLNDALEDFYSGKVDIVLWLPSEDINGENFIQVFMPKDEITSIQASVFIKKKLIEYQNYLRKLRGIPEEEKLSVFTPDFTPLNVPEGVSMVFKFIYVVLIPLMMITTAVIASGLLIDLITEERETETLIPLLAAAEGSEIITGKMMAAVILPVLLTPLWLFLLMINGVEIANFFAVLSIAYAFSFFMISLSALIVTFFRDRERSQLVFSIVTVGLMPILFIHPFMPAAMITRISAGSEYGIEFSLLHLFGGLLVLLISRKLFRL